MPHLATMFLVFTLVVVFLSWISDIYGLSAVHPATGELIKVQSLLSPEGLRWLLRHVVTNFTGFAPLGMVMVTMLGLGVAEHSGFINACIRRGLKNSMNRPLVVCSVIFLGIISNVVGDAGYIILTPLSALLFRAVGLHPVAGIITAYVSVACGFGANLFISTLDPLLARYTQEAVAFSGNYQGSVGALSNYWFMSVSTFLIGGVIYWVTRRYLLPVLGEYQVSVDIYKQLSRKERRALLVAVGVGVVYIVVILFATFSPWGFLRGITGGMTRSPFIAGALFLISFGAGLVGVVYGFTSGRYRSDVDVVKGMSQPLLLLASYFVVVFFAAQMFSCVEYSRLDEYLSVMGANKMISVPIGSDLGVLLLFILFTAMVNLIMVSSSAKWVFMSFVFVPAFVRMGIAPDWTQCAFRIGDSMTNAITPFLFYMPLVLAYMQQYDKESDYGVLLRYTWHYSLYISLGWILLFIGWYMLKLPLGL